ncbi:hypothetical protein ACRYCC_33295 [Actinomadura scrupuli]|uniref:hypothetical protein n=1 Tax=Actinomadura scrupuli TaxID=559629 RepID=UPI003D985B07
MKPFLSRARLVSGLAATAVAASVLAGPATAHADTAFVPSAADFENCPALPAGAARLLWNCVSVTLAAGTIKLGSLNQTLSSPIQLNVAVGPQNGKLTTITGDLGGGPPMQVPTGIDFPGLDSVGIQVQQAGDLQSDGLLPTAIPIKVKVIQPLLGNNCSIGTNAAPITIRPVVSNLRAQLLAGAPVIRADVSDSTFAIPGASGCGLLTGLVNSVVGLPSASGKNSATLDTIVQVRNYALGNITTKVAAGLT